MDLDLLSTLPLQQAQHYALSLEGAGGILQKEEALPSSSVLLFGGFSCTYFTADISCMYKDIQCLSAPRACPECMVPQWDHGPRLSLVTTSLCPFWHGHLTCLFLCCSAIRQASDAMIPSMSTCQHSGSIECGFSNSGSCRVQLSLLLPLAEHLVPNAEFLSNTISQALDAYKVCDFLWHPDSAEDNFSNSMRHEVATSQLLPMASLPMTL